jgi:hypothetical protein
MAKPVSSGSGTKERPWKMRTPSGMSAYTAYGDPTASPPALVVRVGSTELRYHLRCLHDLDSLLRSRRESVDLGSTDEQKPAAEGTVEAWARSPIGGGYGVKKGLRGRFANYVSPVLEALGRAEVEHFPKNNRMREGSP